MKNVRIVKRIGIISKGKFDSKEVNIVEWNEGFKVIDIRKWADDDAHKGISLSLTEAELLQKYLSEAICEMRAIVSEQANSNYINTGDLAPLRDEDVQ